MRRKTVSIIDYGVGNVSSVSHALDFLGYKVKVGNSEECVKESDAVILPGVGAFEFAMRSIRKLNLDEILKMFAVKEGKPLLGICLGMQVLFSSSEENGVHQGLGWIPGKVTKILPGQGISVPNVGWSTIDLNESDTFFSRLEIDSCFYFDHSYSAKCEPEYITSSINYGNNQIVSSVAKENIYGVQFHPEKSDKSGLKLLRKFVESIREGSCEV